MNMPLSEFEHFLSPDMSLSEYLLAMTECIQSTTGCEHVGIRIKDDDGNIPYAALIGFEDEDWRSTEPYVNTKRDCCFCTRMNEGTPDPYECSYLSGRGSLHISSCEEFTAHMDQNQASRYIGKCLDIGISSMVLVPLMAGSKIKGTIHVADNCTRAVSESMVTDMEHVAPLIVRRIERDKNPEKLDGM